MWDFGSTNLVRLGNTVFLSGLETKVGVPPLNNSRCNLWLRDAIEWKFLQSDPSGDTREPCPLAAFPRQNKLFLSANPTLNPPGTPGAGPAKPTVLEFSVDSVLQPPKRLSPTWRKNLDPRSFTEHSYRSFSADGNLGHLMLFQNVGDSHAEWTFRNEKGQWDSQGQLNWPNRTEMGTSQPMRVCYPNVALRDRSVHFVGVSNIVEPNEGWRQFKLELTGQKWDYTYRRLFYTWTPDIGRQSFSKWIELANREKTAGHIVPGDLWLAPDGSAHIVWAETAIDVRLRARFFPKETQGSELNYAIVREGRVESRQTLFRADDGKTGFIAQLPRFHLTPEGRLLVFFYVDGGNESNKSVSENRLLEIRKDGTVGSIVRVPLTRPLKVYMTATPRAGSATSRYIDLIGTEPGKQDTVRYARVRLD